MKGFCLVSLLHGSHSRVWDACNSMHDAMVELNGGECGEVRNCVHRVGRVHACVCAARVLCIARNGVAGLCTHNILQKKTAVQTEGNTTTHSECRVKRQKY